MGFLKIGKVVASRLRLTGEGDKNVGGLPLFLIKFSKSTISGHWASCRV